MGILLTATFGTRREAEMTVERLVQEFDVERTAISISTEDDENSAGEQRAGSDNADGGPGQERDDAALNGAIVVTADVADEDAAEKVRSAFGEFDAEGVVETDKSEG